MIEYVIGCAAGTISTAIVTIIFPRDAWREARRLKKENDYLRMQIQQLLWRNGLGTWKSQVWNQKKESK